MFSSSDHTFVVCAYKQSPYLADCIVSLLKQTTKPRIIISTSTPNENIEYLSEHFSIPLVVHDTQPGIASDWNNALDAAATPLVTIAHQDDVYSASYLFDMLSLVNRSRDPLLYFTNYGELRDGAFIDTNTLLDAKRRLLAPLTHAWAGHNKFIRRRILSLGNPICCPSVTFIKDKLEQRFFKDDMMSNLDWQAWAVLAAKEGDFIYNPAVSMYHRIHKDSETSHLIHTTKRSAEDLHMLEMFWPKPIAKAICRVYVKGQHSNEQ